MTFNSYQRENSLENKIKFQGQEHVDDLNLGWVSFKWRNHDPAIGRFFNVDPLAEKYVYNSPYAFSENKVTSHIELEGLEAVAARSGVQNLVIVVQGYTGVDPPNGATQAQNSPRTSGGIDHGVYQPPIDWTDSSFWLCSISRISCSADKQK